MAKKYFIARYQKNYKDEILKFKMENPKLFKPKTNRPMVNTVKNKLTKKMTP